MRGYHVEFDHNSGSCSLDIDDDHAGLNSGFCDNSLHLTGDVIETILGLGGDVYGLLHKLNITLTIKVNNLLRNDKAIIYH